MLLIKTLSEVMGRDVRSSRCHWWDSTLSVTALSLSTATLRTVPSTVRANTSRIQTLAPVTFALLLGDGLQESAISPGSVEAA